MLTRRTVLLGGGGVLALGTVGTLGAVLGRPGDAGYEATSPGAVPNVDPGPVERGRLTSRARLGRTVSWSLLRPPDVTGALPLVVALHGHGGTTAGLLGPDFALPQFLAAAVADGVAPFALATVDGGTGFWHERPSGEDAGAMVTDEFLPMLLARDDVAVGPVGLIGWSMGGYGVLRLAGLLGPARVAAVVASSPGLYTDPELAHPNGFEDAAEYERYSVMARQDELVGIPVRVDIGTDDPFHDATRTYVAGFADDAELTVDFGEGGHEFGYSRRMLPAELAFLGTHVGLQA